MVNFLTLTSGKGVNTKIVSHETSTQILNVSICVGVSECVSRCKKFL